jgi:heat shock protein HslJ
MRRRGRIERGSRIDPGDTAWNRIPSSGVTPKMNWRSGLLLSIFALTGCTFTSAPVQPLDGTEWLSMAVTDDGVDRPLVDGTQVRLAFADAQLSASAGCNTMSGTYGIENGRLVVDGAAMTEMGCDEERHAQDDWLFGFLGSEPEIQQDGVKLTLTSGATVITFQDREVAEPDLPLTGTIWTVDSLISGDAVSSVPGDAVATIAFTDDGQIEVDTGCNTGAGTYQVSDGSIELRDIATTEIGCEGAAGQLEAAVIAVLMAGEADFTIDAGTLTLMAGDVGLGLLGEASP